MVVYSHQFILAAVSHYEAQVDTARIARDYERVGNLRFRAVWFREWLMFFPRENKADGQNPVLHKPAREWQGTEELKVNLQ